MSEISDHVAEQIEKAGESKLNTWIAVSVAISAACVTIFNIKDNNIVQGMGQAQAHAIDTWSFYQSKSTKQHLAENSKAQLEVQLMIQERMSAGSKNKILEEVRRHEIQIQKYEKEKAELKEKAEGFQAEYDRLNLHDDQFDMAEALISLAMALFGLSALTRKRALFAFASVMSLWGIVLGLAGFIGWDLHPDWLARLLG